MKTNTMQLYAVALIATLAAAPLAAHVTTGDTNAGGVGYAFYVEFHNNNSTHSVTSHVGAWSWEDNALFNASNGEPPVGWTHTSNWVALSLEAPANITIRLARQEGVAWPSAELPDRTASVTSMFPSFTLWSNWDNDDGDSHTYNNRGNVSWAEDLVYINHVDNSTEASIERTFTLAAGEYSFALGSNAPATDTNRQGYSATFTASPVPEPSTYALMAVGVAFLLLWPRRR